MAVVLGCWVVVVVVVVVFVTVAVAVVVVMALQVAIPSYPESASRLLQHAHTFTRARTNARTNARAQVIVRALLRELTADEVPRWVYEECCRSPRLWDALEGDGLLRQCRGDQDVVKASRPCSIVCVVCACMCESE